MMEDETINLLLKFPNYIEELNLANQNIFGTLNLYRFTKLKILNCSLNPIDEIINVPKTLKIFIKMY